MAYTPSSASQQAPAQPGNPVTTSPTMKSEASEALGRPSLSFDSNSGCTRLTPLLSWNYFSLLSSSAFWYERPLDGNFTVGFTGTLKKGNAYTVIAAPPQPEANANIVGLPTPVTPVVGAVAAVVSTKNQTVNQVSGIGRTRSYTNSWVDQQSATANNHMNNWFVPTNLENAWKEMATSEIASLSNDDSIPNFLIRSNYDFFKCGQDPLPLTDPTSKYTNLDANLAEEYILTSSFTLPENSSFAITWKVYNMEATSGQSADPKGKGYFRVYWAAYCFQFNGTDAMFCPNTAGEEASWTFHPVGGLKLQPRNNKELITLIFEVIGDHIVISNAIDTGDPDHRDKRPSWGYTDLENFTTLADSFGITVPATNLVIGVRAMDIAWSYIPVVYPPQGTLSVANLETGYSISGLRSSNVVDTHNVMGGYTNVVPTISDSNTGTFGYTIKIHREATVDKSPALRSFELIADPAYTAISIAAFPVTNRIRACSLRLGTESQEGSLTFDNRDGLLSSVGGIIPCEISTGWAGSPSITSTTIFKGFITNQGTTKSSNQSHAEFNLVGSDLVLKDAIALNLPIYDGWDSGEAIQDLINRGGWASTSDIQTGDYQLTVGVLKDPVWKFALGQSIMACIRDIARAAGYWAFVDNLGVFHYIQQSVGYGEFIGTYREVPTLNAYDEWQSLGGIKASDDARNATLVVGVELGVNELPIPIASVQTDPGGTVGDYLSDTIIPWLRWQIYQDPKINTVEAAQGIASKLFSNSNRLRLTISGALWGDPMLLPWQKIGIQLRRDDVGIPGGAQWRITNALHTVNADDRTNYVCNLECEYIDPRFSYQSFYQDD